jgi:hypothetical protein
VDSGTEDYDILIDKQNSNQSRVPQRKDTQQLFGLDILQPQSKQIKEIVKENIINHVFMINQFVSIYVIIILGLLIDTALYQSVPQLL